MSMISKVLEFYRDCYSYDYRSTSIKNFFGRSTQSVLVLENSYPVTNGEFDYLVDKRWGDKTSKELELNEKEKSLVAGSLFLFGTAKVLGKIARIATPLFLHEVRLAGNFGNYRICLDLENHVINPYFLEFLKANHSEVDISYEDFTAAIPTGPLTAANIIKLESLFVQLFPFLDCSKLNKLLIQHATPENARFLYKENRIADQNRLVCGFCIALVNKQKGSRGVINELDQLAKIDTKTSALNTIFERQSRFKSRDRSVTIEVPVPLSQAQKEVFYNAENEQISLVIGPPGTGKSHTIAALTSHLIAKRQSVLIASKNTQAGRVVSQKIENDVGLKGLVIKATRKSYKRHLTNKINKILSGTERNNVASDVEIRNERNQLGILADKINSKIKNIQKREQEEHQWGQFFNQYQDGFFKKYQKKWIQYKHRNAKKIWNLKSEIDSLKYKQRKSLRKYIKQKYDYNLATTLKRHRSDLRHFSKSLSAETGRSIQKHFNSTDFENVLLAIPAWIINAADAHEILPLKEKIFDVLIIDEATQCDIASCLPLIYRAKQVVIVGDPKQLRHLSFLSKTREDVLNRKYNLSGMQYRDYSILDLISDKIPRQSQVTYLNEHFRSFPDIISFSNQKFYNGSLHLMTANPVTNIQKHLFLKIVGGVKNKRGENQEEAKAILVKLESIIKNESLVDKDLSSSLGIISPFRAQVSLIKAMVKKALNLDQIKKHHILIGTPYHFQGEERDVIMLSFVIDKNTHPATYNYLNRPDVFNVSITRARSLQLIYTSVSAEQVDTKLLFHEYLSHIEAPRRPKKNTIATSELDKFTSEIKQTIANWQVDRILISYAISGVIIDLVVVNKHKTYCIDLIGYPGEFVAMFNEYQLDMLDRMGHKVFFLPYSEWHLNRADTIESLHKFLFTA